LRGGGTGTSRDWIYSTVPYNSSSSTICCWWCCLDTCFCFTAWPSLDLLRDENLEYYFPMKFREFIVQLSMTVSWRIYSTCRYLVLLSVLSSCYLTGRFSRSSLTYGWPSPPLSSVCFQTDSVRLVLDWRCEFPVEYHLPIRLALLAHLCGCPSPLMICPRILSCDLCCSGRATEVQLYDVVKTMTSRPSLCGDALGIIPVLYVSPRVWVLTVLVIPLCWLIHFSYTFSYTSYISPLYFILHHRILS